MLRIPVGALVLLSLCPAWAQQPGDWGVEPGPELPGLEAPLTPSLWLPRPTKGGATLYAAITGMHAALLEADREEPQTFVLLQGMFRLDEERALDPAQAVLVVGERELAPTGASLGDNPPGRRVIAGDDGRGHVQYLLAFPALEPEWSALELRIPWADGEGNPVRVEFFRFRERLAQVEAELQAWIAFTQEPQVMIHSAIDPYLDCEAYLRFRDHGERFVVPFLLRELARQTPTYREGTLPRFLVFHVLSETEWGRRQQVRSGSGDQDARRLLRRWRASNTPSLPTIRPEREVKLD